MSKLSIVRRVIPNAATVKVGRTALRLSNNSPHILFGVGVAGFITTTVLASRATLEVDKVLSNAQHKLEDVKTVLGNEDYPGYTDEQALKDRAVILIHTTFELGKLYGPALLVGGLSLACFTKAHLVLNARVGAVTAAYATLDQAYREYRRRVADEFGDDEERRIAFSDSKAELIKQNDGNVKSVVKVAPNSFSPYARFFDETSTSWQRRAELNGIFLRAQQNYANDLLRSRGHVFLNEVYDMLGLERSRAGAVVGWTISKEGDNYIDFGFMDGNNPRARDFVNGREGSILLDFNVDGVIYDRI